MADPTERGTLGFEFEFFPTAISQWTAADIQKYIDAENDWHGSKVDGSETSEQLAQIYPGTLVLPGEARWGKGAFIFPHIINYLRERGVHTNDIDDMLEPMLPADQALWAQPTPFAENVFKELYHRWSVTDDGSVSFRGTFDPEAQNPRDSYFEAEMRSCGGVELISPALTDSPESFAEVKKVFTLVRDLDLIHVNNTCGLHVHAAFGKHPITIAPLRKIASLLFALDPLLSSLRPDSRSGNTHCLSIRKFSNAARGYRLVDAIKGLKNPRKNVVDEDEADYFMPEPKANVLDWVPIADAVQAIAECKKPEHVAWLMTTQERANYDFKKFVDGTFNPTIEFREHEATLDVDEVLAWGRFCVGVVRYAAHEMSKEDLEKIVGICHDAETKPEPGRFYLWELFGFMKMSNNLKLKS
ncbi:hypothetical protein PG991_013074 [Apiospora marii]|uniref:Amidoligase enzyme n=1 Tax=Apiospora marii TaxID=335849 RepID=A0ABR1R4X7_9PEZI